MPLLIVSATLDPKRTAPRNSHMPATTTACTPWTVGWEVCELTFVEPITCAVCSVQSRRTKPLYSWQPLAHLSHGECFRPDGRAETICLHTLVFVGMMLSTDCTVTSQTLKLTTSLAPIPQATKIVRKMDTTKIHKYSENILSVVYVRPATRSTIRYQAVQDRSALCTDFTAPTVCLQHSYSSCKDASLLRR